jgi:hypothetical protein
MLSIACPLSAWTIDVYQWWEKLWYLVNETGIECRSVREGFGGWRRELLPGKSYLRKTSCEVSARPGLSECNR